MNILDIVLAAFIILETLNVLALYFSPTLKQANSVGVFKEWDRSKEDPANHRFINYLVNWIAGTKAIFLALLIVILFFADETVKLIATGALILSISLFYWRMHSIIRTMDKKNELTSPGYSRTLALMIGSILIALSVSMLLAFL